jgi:hypothetical protein
VKENDLAGVKRNQSSLSLIGETSLEAELEDEVTGETKTEYVHLFCPFKNHLWSALKSRLGIWKDKLGKCNYPRMVNRALAPSTRCLKRVIEPGIDIRRTTLLFGVRS